MSRPRSDDWHVDAEGRRYQDRLGVRYYATTQERDSALESKFELFCNADGARCCRSLLQCIATHAEGLVAEYIQYAHEGRDKPSDAACLERWAYERFGDDPYPAARAMLTHLVKTKLFGEGYRIRPRKEDAE